MIDFYDQLSPFYHLLYKDWEAGMVWQAERLRDIIRAQWGAQVQSVLDVSCGIGTQSLGLACLGFQVTASDLSPHAIARAKKEAAARNLRIPFWGFLPNAPFGHIPRWKQQTGEVKAHGLNGRTCLNCQVFA